MAATLSGLAGVPPFEFNTIYISGLATKWLSWKASFEIFVVASGVTNDTEKRALLLHMGGGQLQKLFHTLQDTGDVTDYAECIQAQMCQKKGSISSLYHRKVVKQWTAVCCCRIQRIPRVSRNTTQEGCSLLAAEQRRS